MTEKRCSGGWDKVEEVYTLSGKLRDAHKDGHRYNEQRTAANTKAGKDSAEKSDNKTQKKRHLTPP